MSRFEEEYAKFLASQMRQASGMRLEMLKKHGAGEKKLLEILFSIFKSFDNFILEYEIVTSTGVRNYIDAFYVPLGIAFEAEGFVVHAEKITRDRFDSERNKVRSAAIKRYIYFPFTWDDMDKRPDLCRRAVYELLGQYAMDGGSNDSELTIYEREIIRRGLQHKDTLSFSNMCVILNSSARFTRSVIQRMVEKRILRPTKPGAKRVHRYVLDQDAHKLLR